MATWFFLCVLLCACGSLVNGFHGPYSIPIQRKEASAFLPRKYGSRRPVIGKKSLYWFGNFSVGGLQNVELLLDTGSGHVELNPGVYKPSPSSRPFSFPHYNGTFEGIDKEGTGTVVVQGNVVVDEVSNGVLTITNQTIGNMTSFKISGVPKRSTVFVHSPGVLGLQGFREGYWCLEYTTHANCSKPSVHSWISNLCNKGLIAECRFGMAFGTNHKGFQVIGGVDNSLFKEQLTHAPLDHGPYNAYGSWAARADITLNNKIIIYNQTIVFDSGTSNIQAPRHQALRIFHKLGYPHITSSEPGVTPGTTYYFTEAFYPCDKPPLLGLSIPSQYDLKHSKSPYISRKSKIFNVHRLEWPLKDNGNNNCTAILSGSNVEVAPAANISAWIMGQPFYQGRYIDHHLLHSLGFADLVNPSGIE